jgi:hypothetical protein
VGEDLLDHQGVLGDREPVLARCLAVPARDAREPVGNVLDLDVERGGVVRTARRSPLATVRVPLLWTGLN